jgi:hypothetical protein
MGPALDGLRASSAALGAEDARIWAEGQKGLQGIVEAIRKALATHRHILQAGGRYPSTARVLSAVTSFRHILSRAKADHPDDPHLLLDGPQGPLLDALEKGLHTVEEVGRLRERLREAREKKGLDDDTVRKSLQTHVTAALLGDEAEVLRARVAELEADERLKRGKEPRGWRPVDDPYPPTGEWVLVCGKDVEGPWRTVARWDVVGAWLVTEHTFLADLFDTRPTHWRPLPEGPGTEGGE